MKGGLKVDRSLVIPADELTMKFSTSGGPGGQHANKTATRVDLSWNVERSRVLSEGQRARLLTKLASRIDTAGELTMSSDRYRSQMRNRQDVNERLARTVARALKEPRSRRPTKPSRSATERRISNKKHHSEKKKQRKVQPDDL